MSANRPSGLVCPEYHKAVCGRLEHERDEARKLAEKYRDAWQQIDVLVCDVAGVGPCDDRPLPWEQK